MAALNIPLITWAVIVIAMTVLITVRLFHKDHRSMRTHHHPGQLLEVGSENMQSPTQMAGLRKDRTA